MQRQPGAMVSGAGLLVAGGGLIAGSLGVTPVPIEALWPLLLSVMGLAMMVQFNASAPSPLRGALALGTMLLLLGIFLLGFTLQINQLDWPALISLWPVFLLIFAAGLSALYIGEAMRDQGLRATIYVVGGIGALALPITTDLYKRPDFLALLQMWPLVVIIILLVIFLGQSHPDIPDEK